VLTLSLTFYLDPHMTRSLAKALVAAGVSLELR